jgi:hypothetical protein
VPVSGKNRFSHFRLDSGVCGMKKKKKKKKKEREEGETHTNHYYESYTCLNCVQAHLNNTVETDKYLSLI